MNASKQELEIALRWALARVDFLDKQIGYGPDGYSEPQSRCRWCKCDDFKNYGEPLEHSPDCWWRWANRLIGQ